MLSQVKQAILDAFSTTPLPRADQLIAPSKGNPVQEEQIRGELAGRRWDSLESSFLAVRWAYFVYLSAAGYRYYLPALLLSCLNDFTPANPLIHSTIYYLTPSYWGLYYRGADATFLYQTSLFSPAQRAAVLAFLELAFDELPGFRYPSAAAIKWGWRLPGTPAAQKCDQYYAEFAHYTYPPAQDARAGELVAQIRAAFESTPYPGDDRLCGSDQGDEPASYALEFRGLDWRTIHPDFLNFNYASLSFFSKEGFRYFLPAYLVADVLGLLASGDPPFHLTHGLVADHTADTIEALAQSGELSGEALELARENERHPKVDWHQYALQRLAVFSLEEKRAIVAYLRFIAERDDFSRPDIEAALESYWLKTSESGKQG
jgi:hypothetical protein